MPFPDSMSRLWPLLHLHSQHCTCPPTPFRHHKSQLFLTLPLHLSLVGTPVTTPSHLDNPAQSFHLRGLISATSARVFASQHCHCKKSPHTQRLRTAHIYSPPSGARSWTWGCWPATLPLRLRGGSFLPLVLRVVLGCGRITPFSSCGGTCVSVASFSYRGTCHQI